MVRLGHGSASAFLLLAATTLAAACTSPPPHPAPTPTRTTRTQPDLRQAAESRLTPSTEVRLRWTGTVGRRRMLNRTTPRLPAGKYVLEAACAGSGAMHFYWNTETPDASGVPELHCGGAPSRYPFSSTDLINFAFEPSAIDPPSGVLAWQITPS